MNHPERGRGNFHAGQVVAFMLSNNEEVFVRLESPVMRSDIVDSWIIRNPDIHQEGTWQVKAGDIRRLTAKEASPVGGSRLSDEEAFANARLIAAAPELLDLVQRVWKHAAIDGSFIVGTSHDLLRVYSPVLLFQDIERVLGKVEGKK